MNKEFHAHTFSDAAVFPVTIFLLALTLNACVAKPAEVPSADQNAAAASPTSKPESKVYDWNGIPLYMNAPWPETPAEVKIYLAQDEVRASVEEVQRLAKQFGMHGEVYETPGEFYGTSDYLVMDGNQQLRVRSERYFTYHPTIVGEALYLSLSASENPDAEALIREFMQTHGFNFEYKIEHEQPGIYSAQALTPDGFVLQVGPYDINGLTFSFDENGIGSVSANLLKYSEAETAGIITAEEALQRFTGSNSLYGWGWGDAHNPNPDQPAKKMWLRPPPLEQKVTYTGFLSVIGKSITDAAPLITLDGYTVTGNIEGISETNMPGFVEATGKFHDKNGVKTFEIESWKVLEDTLFHHGSIQREGEQVVISTTEEKKLILPDFPSEISLPAEDMTIEGAGHEGVLDWKRMANYAFDGFGGGGSGGGGYYKLNLTGAPVLFITPTPMPSPTLTPLEASLPKPVEGLRGFVMVNVFQLPDGSDAKAPTYQFIPESKEYQNTFIMLEGDSLQDLRNYNNRPVDIWGVIDLDGNGVAIKVERYEIPYPDLQFQLIKGTEKIVTIDGQSITLFTTEDNVTYAELHVQGPDLTLPEGAPGLSEDGRPWTEGDQIILEALIIPDETFGGYPALRSFGARPVLDPTAGKPYEQKTTANEPAVLLLDKALAFPTSATIEKVELVYFTPDYRYNTPPPNSEPPYVQPMWRFYGRYDTGDEFEIFFQALKEEFLLPEIQLLY